MLDVLRPVIAVVLTALILWGPARLLGRSAPASLEARSGIIRPELWTAWVTVLIGSLVLLVALRAAISKDGGWAAAAVALLGGATAGFMAPSVTLVHAVRWNETGIEGPSKVFAPTLGRAGTEIPMVAHRQSREDHTTGYWLCRIRRWQARLLKFSLQGLRRAHPGTATSMAGTNTLLLSRAAHLDHSS